MDIRLRAILRTAKILGAGFAGGLAFMAFFTLVPMAYYPAIFITFLLLFAVYTAYTISLSQLRYEEKLKEMVEKK